MWVSRYVCLFVIYSLIGWIYESLYCTFRNGKWENRGFLYGPLCPIYGAGAIGVTLIICLAEQHSIVPNPCMLYIISVVGSALLEYTTSWTLEKLFHAIWWDYSNLPLNINGRISLFTSLGFGFAGLMVVYVFMPFAANLMNNLSIILTEFLALFLLFLFTIDFTLTVVALLHFDRLVTQAEESFNLNMENLVDNAIHHSKRITQEFTARTYTIKEYADTLNGLIHGTVYRVCTFKNKDRQKELFSNTLLSILRNKDSAK